MSAGSESEYPMTSDSAETPSPSVERPSMPSEEPFTTCDWGNCNEDAPYWRWADDLKMWLAVCSAHEKDDQCPHRESRKERLRQAVADAEAELKILEVGPFRD